MYCLQFLRIETNMLEKRKCYKQILQFFFIFTCTSRLRMQTRADRVLQTFKVNPWLIAVIYPLLFYIWHYFIWIFYCVFSYTLHILFGWSLNCLFVMYTILQPFSKNGSIFWVKNVENVLLKNVWLKLPKIKSTDVFKQQIKNSPTEISPFLRYTT